MLLSYVGLVAGSHGSRVERERWTGMNGVVVVKIDDADADVCR